MRRFFSHTSASVLVLGLGLAVADEPKRPEPPPPPAKPDPNAQALQQLLAADTLIDYGRDQKSTVALISAVELLADTPTQPLRDMFKDDPKAQAELDKQTAKDGEDRLQSRLKEAKKLAGDDEHLRALIAQAEKDVTAGHKTAVAGPFATVFIVEPGEKLLTSIAFKGGEEAEVDCQVLGDGQVEIKASDPKEGLDLSDVDPTPRVRWTQRVDGRVNIIRKNLTDHKIRLFVSVP